MIKAFISHKSDQKDFVLSLVNLLGRDRCIIDCYDFEPAYKTIDEIYNKIDSCTIFLLLISEGALESEWIQEEIAHAIKKMAPERYERFWPYIIDRNVQFDKLPGWMKDKLCFNLKYFTAVNILHRDLEQKFRKIVWSMYSNIRNRETIFVGRNRDIEKFEDRIYSITAPKALIVSGRPGVGKDMYIKQCLSKIGYQLEFEPFRISMVAKDSIEDFICHLNAISEKYTSEEITQILSSSIEQKVDTAVALLNGLYDAQGVVFVEDDMTCVMPTQAMSQWLIDVIENQRLEKKLGLFIKSKITPKAYVESQHPYVAQVHLESLNRLDRKMLFCKCMQMLSVNTLSEKDVDFFIDRLVYSPSQIIAAVDVISKHGLNTAKRDLGELISLEDNKVLPLINMFSKDELSSQLMVVLSNLEFASFDLLEQIFQEDYNSILGILDKMQVYGILQYFGPSEKFVRMDHAIVDYLHRNRVRLAPDFESHFTEIIEDNITDDTITADMSLYLYNVKRRILTNQYSKEDFLIPSIVVKAVIDAYNQRDYEDVIQICEQTLNNYHNYYGEIINEIRYWLCLALARLVQKGRFFEEVIKLNSRIEQNFLKGFMFRNLRDFIKAESYYRKVLKERPSMQRAKRELVTVLLELNRFDEAYQLAKDNYVENSENSYHIYAYFRCLVRKELDTENLKLIERLIDEVRASRFVDRDEYAAVMELELNIHNNQDMEIITNQIEELKSLYPASDHVKRVVREFRMK